MSTTGLVSFALMICVALSNGEEQESIHNEMSRRYFPQHQGYPGFPPPNVHPGFPPPNVHPGFPPPNVHPGFPPRPVHPGLPPRPGHPVFPPVQPGQSSVCPIPKPPPPPPHLLPPMPPPPPCPRKNPTDDGRVHQHSYNKIPIVPDCGTNKFGRKRNLQDVLTKEPEVSKRVVGGQLSQEGMWPWTVALIQIPTVGTPQHFCGGSLIGDRWVLTAAHCVVDKNYPCQLRVQIGENTIVGSSHDRQTIGVEKIIAHRQYNGQNFQNDIALMKLSRRINLDSGDANVICLPSRTEQYDRNSCTIIGWGRTFHAHQTGTNNLLHLQIGQLDDHTCRNELMRRNWWASGKICIPTVPGKDACFGDSGGPLVCKNPATRKWILIGATSHGTACRVQCGMEIAPTVYSSVMYYQGWVEDVIRRNGGA